MKKKKKDKNKYFIELATAIKKIEELSTFKETISHS